VFAHLRLPQRFRRAAEPHDEQGGFVPETVQVLQHRRTAVLAAVVAAPSQETDLNGTLRQLEGARIDFAGRELPHAHLKGQVEARLRRVGDEYLLRLE